ncbi:hypothetical protein BWI17_17225 [Betaproteobacteria bacterium GR16-43]|nr:hypothetical protein BWI17_17225 [Betaproteobacteria bacterium GR16-43]
MEERLEAAGGELLAHVRNGVATVTLNRPAALNALTFGMIQGLAAWLEAWVKDERVKVIVLRGAGEKAFCAGGDVRALYEGWKAGRTDLLDFFITEYALDFRIHTFPKPVVAVMDGIVIGGGMGLAQGASLRIATDKTKMAMPETTIGLFPDVGGSWFLSRSPGHVGTYLGLVGNTIRAADALYAKLADVYLPPESLGRLDEVLTNDVATASYPRGALDAVKAKLGAEPKEPGELPGLRKAIDMIFGMPSPAAIAEALTTTDFGVGDWPERTRAALAKRSPTMLAVTQEQLHRGRQSSLAEVFRTELGMVATALEYGDFMEGVRALLVDKDNAPRWRVASVDAVPEADVAKFFARRWSDAAHPLAHLK